MNNGNFSKYLALLVGVVLLLAIVAFMKFKIFPQSHALEPHTFDAKGQEEQGKTGVLQKTDTAPVVGQSISAPDFTMDSSIYSASAVTVISNFEKDEPQSWQGNGVVDEKIYFQGIRSLGIVSTDRKGSTVFLEKQMDLTDMKMIEFMINVGDADSYETATLDFGEPEMKSYYRYSLTNLKNGWNLIQIPKEKFILSKAKDAEFNWSNIGKVRFYLLSRPSSVFWVRLDMMRSINAPDNYLQHWRAAKGDIFFSLFEQEGKNKLLARNMGSTIAVLKDVEDINDFTFSATVSPQGSGRSGLFIRGNYNNGYGYYFLIGGDKKNNWQITKRNKDGWTPKDQIVEGVLQNVVFSKDKKYTLKADANGDTMTFYFSFDGQKFEKLGEITDSEFRGGGVGITVFDGGSWSLFDDFQFKRL